MRDPETKTIDGIQFRITPLGFNEGRRGFVRLSKLLGPALGAAASAGTKDPEGLAGALERALGGLTDEDLEWFADVMGKATQFSDDGSRWPWLTKDNREALFSGRLMLFFRWLVFALEVNYSDFLDWLKSEIGDGAPAGPASPDSQP